ncbi:hypothetical protein C8R43DRAFT_959775 [Mycena crocata]|nr:hypothetical protein C8R43DRAFT_959775 [Mycena crocata]
MPPRPKPRALDEIESFDADESLVDEDPMDPDHIVVKPGQRKAQAKAIKKAVWKGAAPLGPAANEAGRKRAASTAKQSEKVKTSKTAHPPDDEDEAMEESISSQVSRTTRRTKPIQSEDDAPEPKPERPKRAATSKATAKPQSDDDDNAPEPKTKRAVALKVSKVAPKSATRKKPVTRAAASVEEDADDAASESEEAPLNAGDEESEHEGDDDDLTGLGDEQLHAKFEEETPRWTTNDDSDFEPSVSIPAFKPGHSRSSSRASFSSGHLSVPESSRADSEDGSESDVDPDLKAAFGSMDDVQQLVPSKPSPATMSRHAATDVSATSSARGLGKRDIERNAREVPSWNAEQPTAVTKPKKSVTIKREPKDATLRPPHQRVKTEPVAVQLREDEDGVILIDDDDDDSIALVYNNTGTINLKQQAPPRFLLFRGAYVDMDGQIVYSLVTSARDQNYPLIEARIRKDVVYTAALASLLYGRVSSFRGNVKTFATAHLFGQYHIQNDCSKQVKELLRAQAYVYGRRPGGVDPDTNLSKPDQVSWSKPFAHPGITVVVGHFFKGRQAIAERCSAMFKPNKSGKKECTKHMVALAGAAIHSALNDWSTGEHKISNFEGSSAQAVYETLLLLLDKTEREKPEQYHTLMETMFETVSRGTTLGKASLSAMQKEALAMIDLS